MSPLCATLASISIALLLIGCDNKTADTSALETPSKSQNDVSMIKLYKKVNDQWHYHEAWVGDGEITEHWGVVGDRGSTRDHPISSGRAESAALSEVLKDAYAKGFTEVDLDDHAILLVEYAVDGFGTPQDLDKRHRLQDRLNETLGWTGLGYCDGGSIGSDTMEAACYVVDFEVAKAVVEKDLRGTEFEDFTRIYDERDPKS
jgi:hypothetical protein